MKVAIVLNDDFSMYRFNGKLIQTLVNKGADVYIIVPDGPFVIKLASLGTTVITVPVSRFISPVNDLMFMFKVYLICNKYNFDIVHTMSIKPNIFASIGASMAGVKKIIGVVSGLGFVFSKESGLRKRVLKCIVMDLYKYAIKKMDMMSFQNEDDMKYFINNGLIEKQKAVVIRSSGTNTGEFSINNIDSNVLQQLKSEWGIPSQSKCVVMVAARLVWSKGIREFIEAAGAFMHLYPDWVFVLLCPRDHGSPDSVPQKYMEEHAYENLIVMNQFIPDVKKYKYLIALADIVTLPSYYPEGVPTVLIEALSMSKPIITTNMPGCKEVVKHAENGFLIEPQNISAFIEKLQILIADREVRCKYGKYSRIIAVENFDEDIVVNKTITYLYNI